MQGIKKIKDKILSDAKRESKRIISEAQKIADDINKENNGLVSAQKKVKELEIKAEVRLYQDKTLAQARLKKKRVFLEKREEIYGKFLSESLDKLDKKSKEYSSFMESLLKKNSSLLGSDITAFCNKDDLKLVKSLDESGNFGVKVEVGDLTGGLIFMDSSGKKVDESISAIIIRENNELRQKVMGVLEE